MQKVRTLEFLKSRVEMLLLPCLLSNFRALVLLNISFDIFFQRESSRDLSDRKRPSIMNTKNLFGSLKSRGFDAEKLAKLMLRSTSLQLLLDLFVLLRWG
jgi:hypothetical protein